MKLPYVLTGGWDLVGFSWDIPLIGTNFDKMGFEYMLAEMKTKKEEYRLFELGGMEYKFQSYKTRGGLTFSTDYYSLFINPLMTPSVRGQLHSLGVHKYGHDKLWEMVRSFFKHFEINLVWYGDPKIFRADYKIDMHIEKFDLTVKNVVSRAKKRGQFYEYEEQNSLTVGKRGKSSVYARIYDKWVEMAHTNTFWYLDYLETIEGFDKSLPLWRIEFEIGGDYLKKKGITTWEDLMKKGGSLIMFLMKEHLRLVINPDQLVVPPNYVEEE